MPKLAILGTPYYRAVFEDAPVGTEILKVNIKDLHLWHRSLNYSISGGGGIFNMNPSTGL